MVIIGSFLAAAFLDGRCDTRASTIRFTVISFVAALSLWGMLVVVPFSAFLMPERVRYAVGEVLGG